MRPTLKQKSQSQKDVLQFNELYDENIDFSQFQNYNPKLNYQHNRNTPNFPHPVPQNFNYNNYYNNFNINSHIYNQNFNCPQPNNQTIYNNSFHNQSNPMNNGSNYFGTTNNFVPNHNFNNFNNYGNVSPNYGDASPIYGNVSPNYYNNSNINNNYIQKPNLNHNQLSNFSDVCKMTTNMNNMTINNVNCINNNMKYNSTNSLNHNLMHNYEKNDSLNTSANNSFDDLKNLLTIRAPPKKTFSDSNLKFIKNNQENPIKSLFKEKIDSINEDMNLAEILSNQNFDLPEFIKSQKGSRIMQKELNNISPENLEFLLNRLCPGLTGIMIDTYGNYFSQKLIQCCSPQQRLKILKSVILNLNRLLKILS